VSVPTVVEEAARDAVARCLAAPPSLGAGRLLCVDGPSGSGKTTFARSVRRAVPAGISVRVVHLDALYPGWGGLAEGVERVARGLLAPLAAGRPGGYRRYDWVAGGEAEWVEIQPVDLLVLEGVGAGGDGSLTPWVTLLVWLEASRDVRTGRALERDGLATEAQLRAWWQQEDAWFEQHRTRERAGLLVVNEG
jgi:energy-coupling factor transporter ATP-binding protein EcfA2